MLQETNSAVDNFRAQTDSANDSRNFEPLTASILELKKDNQSWQQNISDINQQVDMRTLGFPEDFKILDVQDNGELRTVSEDGRRLQARNPKDWSIEEQSTRPPYALQEGDIITRQMSNDERDDVTPEQTTPEQNSVTPATNEPTLAAWGSSGREYSVNSDGSAEYVAKPGDNYWSVARDLVEQNLGHRVDLANAQDVRALNSFTEQLVAFNGKSIVDGQAHLAFGETIKIPPQGANPNSVFSESSVSNQTSVPGERSVWDQPSPSSERSVSTPVAPSEAPIDTSSISVNDAHVRFGSQEWARQTQLNREAIRSQRHENVPRHESTHRREYNSTQDFMERNYIGPPERLNPGYAMYNPIEPAGFQGEPGETWTQPQTDEGSVLRRMYLENPRDFEDGSKMYLYKGDLADGNQFMASEKHDADGQLRMRKAMYRHGAPMRFHLESGPLDVKVKFIESCRDRSTGAWRTQIETADPSQPNGKAKTPLRVITTPDGRSRLVTQQEFESPL